MENLTTAKNGISKTFSQIHLAEYVMSKEQKMTKSTSVFNQMASQFGQA